MNKILIFVAGIALIGVITYFYIDYKNHIVADQSIPNFGIGTEDIYKVEVNKELSHSTLYPPTNITTKEATNSITLSWSFAQKKLVAQDPQNAPYIVHTGFRIYRDGYWYRDISGTNTYTDQGLFPDEAYTYTIVPLTFDNKIEGSASAEVKAKTIKSEPVYRQNTKKDSYQRYLASGDSITEGQRAAPKKGWVDQFTAYLKKNNRDIQLFNKGITGTTSSQLNDRISEEIEESNPDLMTIEVGINDLTAGFETERGNYSIGNVRDSLRNLIRKSISNDRLLLVLNIPYQNCCSKKWDTQADKRDAWNKAIRDTAYEFGLQSIDIYKPMKTAGDAKSLADDSLHPSQGGHDIIAETVIKAFEENEKNSR